MDQGKSISAKKDLRLNAPTINIYTADYSNELFIKSFLYYTAKTPALTRS